MKKKKGKKKGAGKRKKQEPQANPTEFKPLLFRVGVLPDNFFWPDNIEQDDEKK